MLNNSSETVIYLFIFFYFSGFFEKFKKNRIDLKQIFCDTVNVVIVTFDQ